MISINGVECYTPVKFRDTYFSNYGVSENGDIYNIKTKNKLSTWPGDGIDQYQTISLYDDAGDKVLASVHGVVYETITGEYVAGNGYDIDHINGKKWDNRFSNLQKMKHIDNVQKSTKGKRRNKPMQTNISDEVARDICEMLSKGIEPGVITRTKGYSSQWVIGILNRDYCLEISKDYTWNLKPKAGITIPDSVIHSICKDIASGDLGLRAIARKYGVSPSMVMDLRHGKRRSDITSQYDFSGKTDAEKLNLGPHEIAKPYVTKDGKSTNIIVTSQGRFFRAKTLNEQHPSPQHNDLCVSVKIDGKSEYNIPCKKIVAETFCENPKGYRDIINIDKNLYNLAANNLRYVSHSKSCMDNTRYDLRKSYEEDNNPNSKLTPEDVDTILRMYHEMDIKTKVIAKQFNVTKELIGKIVRGDLWAKRYLEYMNKPKGMLKIKFRTDW